MAAIPTKPDWVNDDPNVPPRDAPEGHDRVTGRFLPGYSGNPAGRAKGSKNKRTILREELEQHGMELAQAIKRKALDGDSSCMSMWLARLEPPLRSAARLFEFELDPDASMADQARQIIFAVASGEIEIDTAKEMMNLLSAYCGLRDVEGFMDEIKRLKETAREDRIPGGVKVTT